MTGTSVIPAMIVIMVVIRTQKIINRFKNTRTINPETAKTLSELNIRRGFLFNRLLRRNVFMEITSDRFYLQENNLDEYFKARRMRMLSVVLILILIIFIDIYFLHFNS